MLKYPQSQCCFSGSCAQSNLVPLRVSLLSHPSGSFGAPGGRSALVLIPARWSLCSGPRPGAADRLCCSLSALWDLRINEVYHLFDRPTAMKSSIRFGRYSTWQTETTTDWIQIHTAGESSWVITRISNCPASRLPNCLVFFLLLWNSYLKFKFDELWH